METIYRKTETNILDQFQRQHSNISLENQSAVPRNAYTLESNKQRCCIDENANFIEDFLYSFQHQNQYLSSKTEALLYEHDTSDDNFTSEDSNSDLAIDSEEASVNSLSDGSLDPSEDSEYLQVSSDFDACECCEFHAQEDSDLSSVSQLHCCTNVSPPAFKSACLHEIDMSPGKTHNVKQLLAERTSPEKMVSSETTEPAIVNRIQKAREVGREELVMRSELFCPFQRVGHTETRASPSAHPEATPLMTIRTSRALKSLKIIDWDHLIRYTPNIYVPTLLMIPVEKETQHDTLDISLPFFPEN
ncbi:unnamed protein product [Acanthosepion pharaonis]|uniref:Uncharacterized protein n=1 Tax=Acanthosepion pharaonis TaxID=158019 RepID=A0A812DJ62_ACAPH|nr:unnamed protein product [Sepia pharaonis]